MPVSTIVVVGADVGVRSIARQRLAARLSEHPGLRFECTRKASDAAEFLGKLQTLDLVVVANQFGVPIYELKLTCAKIAEELAKHPNKPRAVFVDDELGEQVGHVFDEPSLEPGILQLVAEIAASIR